MRKVERRGKNWVLTSDGNGVGDFTYKIDVDLELPREMYKEIEEEANQYIGRTAKSPLPALIHAYERVREIYNDALTAKIERLKKEAKARGV